MYLVDMTDWQKIREANPSAAVPVVCDAWTTWWHHSLLPWFSFAQGRGKGQRHRETGAFHIIPFLLEDFECFFEACPKQHRWPAYFPARAGRCRDIKLAWYILQCIAISDLVSFLEVLFFNEVLLVSDQPNQLHLMFLVPGHNDLVETDMRAYFGEVVNFRIADGCSEWNSWRFWYPTFMVHKMASWHVHEPRNCQDRPLGRNESVLNIKLIERSGKTIDMVFFKRNFKIQDIFRAELSSVEVCPGGSFPSRCESNRRGE